MKKIKKRSEWQNLLRVLRNNAAYCRMLNIREIHRKRVLREYIEWDYKVNKKEYDREFEKEWRREQRKPRRIQLGPNFYDLPPDDFE